MNSDIRQAITLVVIAAVVGSPASMSLAEPQLRHDEMTGLRNHISNCWRVPDTPVGTPQTAVTLSIVMNADATIRQATVIDGGRMSSDPVFRSVAESALRAVLTPRCNPYPLRKEDYEAWKTFQLTFDPTLGLR